MTDAEPTNSGPTGVAVPATLPAKLPRWTGIDAVLLTILIALACVVHVRFADADLSYDELWHLSLSAARATPVGWFAGDVVNESPAHVTSIIGAASIAHVWTGMDGVLHPPLYVITLRLWRDVFGDGDRAAQWLSIAWSLVAACGIYGTARLVMGRGLAFICGVAIACSQTQTYFAQEVRGYEMLIGLSTIALWMMTRIDVLGPTRGRAITLGLAPFFILLTHYFGFGAAVAIGVFGLIRLRGHRGAFLAALAGGAILYACIWIPFARRQIAFLGTGDVFMKVAFDPWHELLMLADAPFRLIVDRTYEAGATSLAGGLLFIVPWFLLRKARWLLPWALWLSLSLLALFALDAARSTAHLSLARYFAIASPAVFLLLVGCARAIDVRAAYAIGCSVAFMGAIYLFSGSPIGADSQNFASAEHFLERRIQPGEAILAWHGKAPLFYGDMFLLTMSHSPTLFPRPAANLTKPPSAELLARLPKRAWVITGGVDEPLDQWIPGARVLDQYAADVNVHLFYLDLSDATAATRPSGP